MPSSTIIGAAGEHYVMCQLLRRDLIAALAPAGVPNTDIVVTDQVGDRLFAVQVKVRTDKGDKDAWQLKKKNENVSSPNLYYAFVDFGGSLSEQPKCWVVPSAVVAEVLKASHIAWMEAPGAKGQPHNDNDLRRLRKCYSKWHLKTHQMGWLDEYFEDWGRLEKATKD